MAKRYVVTLTADERGELERVVAVGRSAAWKMQRAWALLKADRGEHGPPPGAAASGPSADGPT